MIPRNVRTSLALIAAITLAACDLTTVGEPIGEERSRSEGTGAGGPGTTGPGGGAPAGVEGAMMTEAQAEAWCQTYVFERHPLAATDPPPVPGPEVAGVVKNYTGISCGPSYMLWRPTVDDCVRNIQHAPCEATVAALDECVDGIIAGWQAQISSTDEMLCPVEGTCDAFLAAACDDVVVHHYDEGDGGGFGGVAVE